jgi:hypothetical protein
MTIRTLASVIGSVLLLAPVFALAAFDVDLRQGDRGAAVTSLQEFLIARGHLSAGNNTAYFGPLTLAAVKAFQSSQGVQPVSGFFGPLTRAAANALGSLVIPPGTDPSRAAQIAALLQQLQELQEQIAAIKAGQCVNVPPPLTADCGQGYQPVKDSRGCTIGWKCPAPRLSALSATPALGTAPLTVAFSGTVEGTSYKIDFGDGSLPFISSCKDSCPPTRSVSANHVYQKPGTYHADLHSAGCDLSVPVALGTPPCVPPAALVRSVSITVSSQQPQSSPLTITSPLKGLLLKTGSALTIEYHFTDMPGTLQQYYVAFALESQTLPRTRYNLGTTNQGEFLTTVPAMPEGTYDLVAEAYTQDNCTVGCVAAALQRVPNFVIHQDDLTP